MMDDNDRTHPPASPGGDGAADAAFAVPPPVPPAGASADEGGEASINGEDSFAALRRDIAALAEDARTYAEAEAQFQKTRATLAGKHAGRAAAFAIVALVLLNIALIALAIGAIMALAPLISIWGATAVVVGVLLIGTALLAAAGLRQAKVLALMFKERAA